MTKSGLLKTVGGLPGTTKRLAGKTLKLFANYWRERWWHKLIVVVIVLVVIFVGLNYGVARWYMASESGKPLTLGATFIPDYAKEFGLKPKKTMSALISGLHVKNFRLVSYWNYIEPLKGKYYFSQLDWEFAKADASNAKVTLAIGLRQPRWPECHAPAWVDTSQPESDWLPALESYMTKVINRYKNNPALASYQLENEYYNNFGKCHNSDRGRLIKEFKMVKKLDPSHPVIMSRSNNWPSLVLGQPRPDIIGMSVYRKVWDGTFTHHYYNYPMPAWYYAAVAGWQKILTGRDSIIHELQAEPWPPDDKNIKQVSLKVQDETLSSKKLKQYYNFAKSTGMRTIYLWGSPYWYYRWQILHDKSVWNAAKAIFNQQAGKI
jgi:hypothetical protein